MNWHQVYGYQTYGQIQHTHTHIVLPHTHLSRTRRRVRSADALRPSLQQADSLCHWRQPVTALWVWSCGDTASRSENCALASGAVRGSCSLSTCHLHSFFTLYIHPRTSSGAQGVPVLREDRALCVCGLSVLTTAVILVQWRWRCGKIHWESAGSDWLFSHPLFLKAIFQGDGLEIVRLNLSVGGWELP